ncbi:hypothetical protein LJC10_00900 [Selenomonadales bacterium OttesenSCG-928-I06]|nr:hypothetical protein [Selenomonadales bacterium OttesenSCG-928-I06]
MDKEKINEFGELVSKKIKVFWDNLSDEVKLAKDVAEVKIQMELLESKQERLFKTFGKAVFLKGDINDPALVPIREEINELEQELQKKYLLLQKLKSSS